MARRYRRPWPLPAWGADPQTYKVRLEGAVSKDIATTLSASSDLVSLRKSAPVSPVGLILRARGDTVRLKTVLESYGYYESAVTATIDGAATHQRRPGRQTGRDTRRQGCRGRRRRTSRVRSITWARSPSRATCRRPCAAS